MDIGTFPIIFIAFPESSKELTVRPFSSQPKSGSMQTPSNFLTCQNATSFLWIPNKLVTIANPDISANIGTIIAINSVFKISDILKFTFSFLFCGY